MEILSDTKERPDVSALERTSSDLAKLIRKLRWIGMEEEAKQMQRVLRHVESASILLVEPHETD